MKRSKVYLCSGIGVAAILAAGISVNAYQTANTSNTQTVYKETTVEKGNLTTGVTESGSIEIGMLTQDVDFEVGTSNMAGQSAGSSDAASSQEALEVEEVYVCVGQQVKEGEALLRLTADSVESYRMQLEHEVTEASADLAEANLSAEKKKLSASYSYNLSVAGGSVAQEEYDATMEQLQKAVDEAQEAVDESASLLNYYQEQIDIGVNLSESLSKEQENYNTLYNKLKSAQSTYTTQSIAAEKAYQETVLASKNASGQYSADITGLDIAVSNAADTLAEAKETLDEFESFVGDGIIYADYDGTVTEVGYVAGDEISSSTSVVTFADAESVTMTVSVSEEDITGIKIGDAVNVELTAYEGQIFPGAVDSMDISVSSGSSTVSYNVTVTLSGDVTGIYADMTGNVTFIGKQVENVLYVSNKAIINEGTTSFVKVKDNDGTIKQVEVTTGFSDGVNVEIQTGLTEGETVLIESQVAVE